MAFKKPSKEEIREKYSIEETDFQILVEGQFPTATQLHNEDSVLEKVANFLGVPTFLKRHRRTGLIVAVILLPGWLPPVMQKATDVVVTTYYFYVDNIPKLNTMLEDHGVYLVYYPEGDKPEQENVEYDFGDMPIASGVTGISATDVHFFT